MATVQGRVSHPPRELDIAEGDPPGEQAADLEVLDRYVMAISDTALGAQAAMQTPDGCVSVVNPPPTPD